MIHSVTANRASFKPVRLHSGLNVVLAERTTSASDRDSRNGSGKTSVVRIIQWCLGSGAKADHPFRVAPELASWSFTLTLDLRGQRVSVTRSVEDSSRVEFRGGDLEQLIPAARHSDEVTWLPVDEWRLELGRLLFGLRAREGASGATMPWPRALLNYLARTEREAYISPFKYFGSQSAAEQQVQHAFLLGLDWNHPAKAKQLVDEGKDLRKGHVAITRSVAREHRIRPDSVEAELEARIVNLRQEVERRAKQLRGFHVVEQYRDIEVEASELTQQLHELAAANVADQQRIEFYVAAIEEEKPADLERLRRTYEEAGIVFGDQLTKRLEDVQGFHQQLILNRREYLDSEIVRLEIEIARRDKTKERLDDRRAQLMKVLEESGALDEYQELQSQHAERVTRVERLQVELDNLRRFETRLAEIRIEKQQLVLDARRDFDARRGAIEEAIRIFGENTDALYPEPGSLLIGVNRDGGYRLDYDIAKGESQGVQEMVVFAYDLMVAELLSRHATKPGFLVHDSAIFDGVDERQRARALVLAERKARECGFQYLSLLNSDSIPTTDLPRDFKLADHTVLTLSDQGEDGGLFGIRF
ncbi:DUF2326 domain-containing protein [Solirubrobacter phytolaccae]|uniref:DUF2326 domain-containing protein n=1 Tax=Solirubrobacter phytolaccae TaxID=1404360 RepID=A0A9X3N5C7_9ACTN|nr:ABC-three component system protein [Solirubrobacter phytolaccae]MDA0179939.1 DUF2326 domain-containing protein [Solirubrobacter phytolaccae]